VTARFFCFSNLTIHTVMKPISHTTPKSAGQTPRPPARRPFTPPRLEHHDLTATTAGTFTFGVAAAS